VTITTVGYGDKLPLSDTGHLIAIGLMIAGIALLGTVTASLASGSCRRSVIPMPRPRRRPRPRWSR